MASIDERSLQSGDVIQKRREADVRAGRGYINDIGEYVPYKKGKGSDWDKESIYKPPSMKKREAEQSAVKKSIRAAATAASEKLRAQLKDSTPEERLYPDIYKARKEREARSKYFPQTGTRSDEEKGFFSGMYDKTVGEYQRGRDEKERLKEETKAAMAAEPDPFVKKEIARKGHEQYMKIAASEGQGERDREAEGGAALTAQRERDKEKYEKMAQHAAYRDREIRDKEVGGGGNTGLDAEAERLKDARVRQESIEREEGPQVHYGTGDEGEKTGFIEKNLRDLPLVGGLFGEKPKDLSGDGQVMEEAYSKFGAGGRMQKAPWEVQKEEEKQKGLEAESALSTHEKARGAGLEEGKTYRDTSEEGKEAAEGEFADSMNQQQAQEAISSLDEEEANAVGEEIKRLKGGQSEEYIDAKEAMRDKDGKQRYVRYEGSGLVINMSMLEKDIKRNENMAMLKHIPIGNRAAMMASWGYIDPGDLSIAQKKSVKEVKELEILNLRANKLQMEADKLSKELSPEKKMKYEQSMIGFRQATKDKDWDTATLYASQMREMGMALKDFDPVALQAASDARLMEGRPPMLALAKKYGIGGSKNPSLDPFYKQQGALSLKLAFLGKDASAGSAGMNFEVKTHTGSKITFGEILNNNGIETWDKVSARINKGGNDPTSVALAKSMGVETLKGISREAYLHYAKSKAHDVISRSVWGPAYDEIKQAGLQTRTEIGKEAEKNFSESQTVVMEPPWKTKKHDPDSNLLKMAKEREVSDKVETKARKVKATKQAAEKYAKDLDKEMMGKGFRVPKTNRFKEARVMTKGEVEEKLLKEGKADLLDIFRQKGKKSGRQGVRREGLFKDHAGLIKYFKDPKNAAELKSQSLAFRVFISKN